VHVVLVFLVRRRSTNNGSHFLCATRMPLLKAMDEMEYCS
jgi:hypothetical protein